MITYKEQSDSSIAVLLDGKRVGTIRSWGYMGWRYTVKGTDATPSTSAG